MNVVVRCSCGGVSTYVEKSIKVLGLDTPCATYVGKDKIRKLAEGYPGSSFAEHLQAVAKKSGRYAFYISTDKAPSEKDQKITAMYNLINGKKVY